jgi:succinate dehydrogenase / fumarate reductase membrane anchor subunit
MSTNPSSIRTPLARVRFLGSARSGTRQSWHMRATSAALVPLTIGFVWLVLTLVGKDYKTVRDTLGSPPAAILMLLFLGTGIYHMKLGMQMIIEDYVHAEQAKTWSLLANDFFCWCIGLACIYAILRISFA